jgi:hypothetical protein
MAWRTRNVQLTIRERPYTAGVASAVLLVLPILAYLFISAMSG